jgi:hypothetical protein
MKKIEVCMLLSSMIATDGMEVKQYDEERKREEGPKRQVGGHMYPRDSAFRQL